MRPVVCPLVSCRASHAADTASRPEKRSSIPSHGPWFAVPLGAILPRGPQSDMAIILANGDFSRLKLQTAPMPPSNRLFVSAPRHKDS
jgi:hypothetical protein